MQRIWGQVTITARWSSGLSGGTRVPGSSPRRGLQPHRVETFELSRDTEFVKKLRDMVGVDLLSPQRALVFCVDEKPQCRRSNRHAEPFIWTATAASILNKVRHCKEALKTAH